MRGRFPFWIALAGLGALGVLGWAPEAAAQGKPKASAAKPAKAARPVAQKKTPEQPAEPAAGKPEEAPASVPPPDAARASGEGEAGVKSAGTKAKDEPEAARGAVSETTSAEGEKSYRFGVIEVEGRLRSPQIIYFLRRVRAEFDAGTLGHRSFLRELSDTRNDPAFR